MAALERPVGDAATRPARLKQWLDTQRTVVDPDYPLPINTASAGSVRCLAAYHSSRWTFVLKPIRDEHHFVPRLL
jgi:hypothetical protein